jgi:hypothetical protein
MVDLIEWSGLLWTCFLVVGHTMREGGRSRSQSANVFFGFVCALLVSSTVGQLVWGDGEGEE